MADNSVPNSSVAPTPWLTLPLHNEEGEFTNGSRFYSLKEDKTYEINFLSDNFGKSRCVGSSHGWLVLVDECANPYLLHPFASAQIALAGIDTFAGIKRVCKTSGDAAQNGFIVKKGKFSSQFFGRHSFKSLKVVQDTFFKKAILSSDPLKEDQKWVAVAMYGEDSKLAYCNSKRRTWKEMDGSHGSYSDVICTNDTIFALSSENASVEAWILKTSILEKVMDIDLSFPIKSSETFSSLQDLCTIKSYIVGSLGDLLLAVRFIGDFVNGEGRPVREEDLLTNEDPHPLVCPYRTLLFHLYKLDFTRNEWVEVESLGDQALFLGGNHSFTISTIRFPECRKNSIYYSDDNWERVDEDYLYGGHDVGTYDLDDERIVPYFMSDTRKILPVPFWMFSDH